MDKIEKALKKLSAKEKGWVIEILNKLSKNDVRGFDVKKLKGRNDIYRIRKGDIRIIYHIQNNGTVFILAIERRSDTTY